MRHGPSPVPIHLTWQYRGNRLVVQFAKYTGVLPLHSKRGRSDDCGDEVPRKKPRTDDDDTWHFISATEDPGCLLIHRWTPPSRQAADAMLSVIAKGIGNVIHSYTSYDPELRIGRALNWLLDEESEDKPVEFGDMTRGEFGAFMCLVNGTNPGEWCFLGKRTYYYSSWF